MKEELERVLDDDNDDAIASNTVEGIMTLST
jgi:hypothetical protein